MQFNLTFDKTEFRSRLANIITTYGQQNLQTINLNNLTIEMLLSQALHCINDDKNNPLRKREGFTQLHQAYLWAIKNVSNGDSYFKKPQGARLATSTTTLLKNIKGLEDTGHLPEGTLATLQHAITIPKDRVQTAFAEASKLNSPDKKVAL